MMSLPDLSSLGSRRAKTDAARVVPTGGRLDADDMPPDVVRRIESMVASKRCFVHKYALIIEDFKRVQGGAFIRIQFTMGHFLRSPADEYFVEECRATGEAYKRAVDELFPEATRTKDEVYTTCNVRMVSVDVHYNFPADFDVSRFFDVLGKTMGYYAADRNLIATDVEFKEPIGPEFPWEDPKRTFVKVLVTWCKPLAPGAFERLSKAFAR